MEKVKAFVIKHQLWFKLAAIALLIAVIFTPYVYIKEIGQGNISKQTAITIFQTVINYRIGTGNYFLFPNMRGECPTQPILAWISFFLIILTIGLICVSLKKQKSLLFSLISFYFSTITAFTFYIYSFFCIKKYLMFGYGVTIPNISFFLLVLLFIFSLFLSCSFYKKWRVKHPKQKTKSEISEKIDDMYVISLQEKIEQDRKIENLENRIKELENRKDGE